VAFLVTWPGRQHCPSHPTAYPQPTTNVPEAPKRQLSVNFKNLPQLHCWTKHPITWPAIFSTDTDQPQLFRLTGRSLSWECNELWTEFLGAFAKLQKATINIVMYACPSVHPIFDDVHRYKGTPLQEYSSKTVHQYNSTTVHQYNSTPVQQYTCTPVQQYTCTTVQQYTSTTVHQYNSTPVRQYTSTTVHQYDSTPVQQYTCTTVQQYTCTTVRQYNSTLVKQYTCTPVQQTKTNKLGYRR
jgi:hypothetical protein